MREVYILIPLLRAPQINLAAEVERVLGVTEEEYTLHDIDEDRVGIELSQMQIGYVELQGILKEQAMCKSRLALLQDALREYDWGAKETSLHSISIDSLMKKAKKYREVKEENKKLKRLLQSQMQNTEKVREETQRTMRVLRQEFDELVKQMGRQRGLGEATTKSG